MAKGVDKKKPKWSAAPEPKKIPKFVDPPIEGGPLAWRFSTCDKKGPFAWSGLTDSVKFKEVIEKLHEFETKTWDEIKKAGSHPIPCVQLEKPARDQLAAIKQDDLDELMSFRLTGANRVWCVQSGNIMRVLWWDPDHQVYIVKKDKADQRKAKR